MASSMSLVPYFFVAGFGLLMAWRGDVHDGWGRRRRFELCIAVVATIYAAGLILAAGFDYFVLSSLLYAPGTILFVIARREQKGAVFEPFEWLILGLVLLGAAAGLWGLGTGSMQF